MSKTTLWHVGIVRQGKEYVVMASKEPNNEYVGKSHMRFRTITRKAAARRFIRGNLRDILFKWHFGDWETHSKVVGYDEKDNSLCRRYMNSLPNFVTIVVN